MSNLFVYKIIFVIEIYIGELLFGITLKKKPLFWLRLIFGILLNMGFALLLGLLPIDNTFVSTLIFPLIFIFSIGVLKFSFDRSLITMIFIGFAAYTVQHFSYELTSFVMSLIIWDRPPIYDMYASNILFFKEFSLHTFFYCWIYFFCFVASYILFYYLFAKRIERKKDFYVKSDTMLIFVGVGLFIDILFNSLIVAFGNSEDIVTGLVNNLYNCFCCVLLLYALFTMIDSTRVKKENQTLQALWKRAEEQYNLSKENIDLINLKCHDLKHQIREYASKRNIDQEAIKDLESVINIYDSTIKTGNEALDLILTEKSLYCQKQNIKLTCLADCSRLIFMHDSDLYSLFGNMIDNAIEAVSKIDNAEKRNINLIVRNIKNYVSIAVENFYEGKINLDNNGLPITTKNNTDYHGYGFKSIKMIVEKYNGDFKISIGEEIFSVYILFKVSEKNEK